MNELQILGLIALPVLMWLYWRERSKHRRTTERMGRALKVMSGRLGVDEGTGLLTLPSFEAQLADEVLRAGRTDRSISVLVVGLDNFGLITNGFDESAVSQVIQTVAGRLVACAGPDARVGKLATAEFVLLVRSGARRSTSTAERMLTECALPIVLAQGAGDVHVTCSIGIAVYPEHGEPSKMVANAGMAMRQSQQAEAGKLLMYTPSMGAQARDEALLVNDLRQAVTQGQLELYFQPKIDARSLKVTAAESLVRWHHPVRGYVSPGVFIPLAERYGVIGAIGDWVIDTACKTASAWTDNGLRMRVAVNISGHQMRQDNLVEKIEAALHANGLEPGRFTCEIAETVAMEDTAATRLTFEKMGRAGLHVSIDDFGTGYSSLASLRQLPAAELKIDRAFVTELETSEKSRTIARSIVDLARSLNLRVVAEGVETAGQRDILVELGCDELQGYLFCMPVNADEIQRMSSSGMVTGYAPFADSLYVTGFMGERAGTKPSDNAPLRG
jgi:diguanylate cyclase (GGDEF)-like protein